MLTINYILKLFISVFFPISIYLNYLTYTNNIEKKEKSIFVEFVLITITFLLIRYNDYSLLSLLMYNIPILVAILLKNKKAYILIITLTIIISIKYFSAYIAILLMKYLIYMLLSAVKNLKVYQILLIYTVIEILLYFYLDVNTTYLLGIPLTLIYSYISYKLLYRGEKVVDYTKVLKELEHEKLLRSSISKLTHELKNPISVCQGYLEMLNIEDKEKTKKYIAIIKEEISRSKLIIDEFSSYGKLKTIDPDILDLNILFEDIKEILTPIYKKNKATIKIDLQEELYIVGDYNKLKQVFINLLKNALEARKEKEKLEVKIQSKIYKNAIEIKVIDNGIGMSKENLEHTSEVFYTTKENGTGLGLAFSKEVVSLHHGYLKIKSKLDKGTEVSVTIPKEQPA